MRLAGGFVAAGSDGAQYQPRLDEEVDEHMGRHGRQQIAPRCDVDYCEQQAQCCGRGRRGCPCTQVSAQERPREVYQAEGKGREHDLQQRARSVALEPVHQHLTEEGLFDDSARKSGIDAQSFEQTFETENVMLDFGYHAGRIGNVAGGRCRGQEPGVG